MFGYSEAEIVGQPIDMLFVPEDRAADAPQDERDTARETGRAADERWHLRKDGTRFYCSGVMAPLIDGVVYGYVKIARDLTEQQLAAAEREQECLRAAARDRAELEESEPAQGRVPRDAVARAAQSAEPDPDAVRDHAPRRRTRKRSPMIVRAVDIIHQTVSTQARLVDDLLDVSRDQHRQARASSSSCCRCRSSWATRSARCSRTRSRSSIALDVDADAASR